MSSDKLIALLSLPKSDLGRAFRDGALLVRQSGNRNAAVYQVQLSEPACRDSVRSVRRDVRACDSVSQLVDSDVILALLGGPDADLPLHTVPLAELHLFSESRARQASSSNPSFGSALALWKKKSVKSATLTAVAKRSPVRRPPSFLEPRRCSRPRVVWGLLASCLLVGAVLSVMSGVGRRANCGRLWRAPLMADDGLSRDGTSRLFALLEARCVALWYRDEGGGDELGHSAMAEAADSAVPLSILIAAATAPDEGRRDAAVDSLLKEVARRWPVAWPSVAGWLGGSSGVLFVDLRVGAAASDRQRWLDELLVRLERGFAAQPAALVIVDARASPASPTTRADGDAIDELVGLFNALIDDSIPRVPSGAAPSTGRGTFLFLSRFPGPAARPVAAQHWSDRLVHRIQHTVAL